MTSTAHEFKLVRRPEGMPQETDFSLEPRELDAPGEDQILVENLLLSVDPYMRPAMYEAEIGKALTGGALGRVLESESSFFSEGDLVSHGLGWRDLVVLDGRAARKLPEVDAPLSAHMGPLGMTGLTAYGGILEVGEIKEGETVFVSGASGAVGSMVLQIANIKGCFTIGSAGSGAKVSHLIDEFGADAAFNYKDGDIAGQLRKAAPEGIDVYFDNVGGEQLAAAIGHAKLDMRVAICGIISAYNEGLGDAPGPSINALWNTIYKRIRLRGFVSYEFEHMRADFIQDMSTWLKEGKIKYQETVLDGLERMPEAFQGLFTGANEGKMLVKLGT